MLFRRKREKEAKQEPAQRRDVVRELCGTNEELHSAMTYVLLLNPERLLELRGIEALAKSGDEALKAGDNTKARISYETAAKLALWKGQASVAQDYFKKALDVSGSQQRKTIYETILKQPGEVAKVAAKYYEIRPSLSQ